MTESEDDYVLIDSPLSGEFRRDGISVNVQIYRGGDEPTWMLEVVDAANTSHVWDDRFATDQEAMQAFLESVKRVGMKQFNPCHSGLH